MLSRLTSITNRSLLNSLNDTLNLVKYAFEYGFRDFLIMPPAYYKNNSEQGVLNFYNNIITKVPKINIVDDFRKFVK